MYGQEVYGAAKDGDAPEVSMSERFATPSAVAALPCWTRLYDGLAAGVVHDLAGRSSALRSLAVIGRRGPPTESFLTDELDAEADTLERLVSAVGVLTRTGVDNDAEQLLSIGSVASDVAGLLGYHHAIDGQALQVRIDPATPASRVRRGELTRLLLLLAADASQSGGCSIDVRSGDAGDRGPGIRVSPTSPPAPGSDNDSSEREALALSTADTTALTAAAATLDITLARADAGNWELRLP